MHIRFILAAMLMLGACAQTVGSEAAPEAAPNAWMQNLTNLPDGGPPVDANGLYNNMGSCPGEGCSISTWQRVRQQARLFEQPTPTSHVVATLAEGEWVRAQNSVHRWRPVRGVVVDEAQAQYYSNGGAPLHVGDVVYTIDYEGEGFVTLWRRGDNASWYDPGGEDPAVGGIRWERVDPSQRDVDNANGAGFWLQVQRDNAQTGWLSAESVECLSGMDPTDACRARNEAPQ
jgi:hypothetical protein